MFASKVEQVIAAACAAALLAGVSEARTGPEGAAPLPDHVLPFRVYSADGKVVGPLFDSDNVVMTIAGRRYVVFMQPVQDSVGKLEYATSFNLLFRSTDCTGQAFTVGGAAGTPYALTVALGKRLLAYRTAGTVEEITFNSQLSWNAGCSPQTGTVPARALEKPIDITDRYQGPFSVK